jgi:hypothetical protein
LIKPYPPEGRGFSKRSFFTSSATFGREGVGFFNLLTLFNLLRRLKSEREIVAYSISLGDGRSAQKKTPFR